MFQDGDACKEMFQDDHGLALVVESDVKAVELPNTLIH